MDDVTIETLKTRIAKRIEEAKRDPNIDEYSVQIIATKNDIDKILEDLPVCCALPIIRGTDDDCKCRAWMIRWC